MPTQSVSQSVVMNKQSTVDFVSSAADASSPHGNPAIDNNLFVSAYDAIKLVQTTDGGQIHIHLIIINFFIGQPQIKHTTLFYRVEHVK